TAVQEGHLVANVCTGPVAAAWWDGVWSSDIQRSALVLTNIDATEAVVSVSLIGETGPIEAAGLRQIEIQRYSTRLIAFEAFGIQSEAPFSVVLRSDRGRVTGLLRSQGELGEDWRAASTAPADHLVLPAVTTSQGDRYLFIANHGSSRAQVELFGLGAGPAVPLTGEMAGAADPITGGLTVAAQTSTRIDVSQALANDLVGLELRSDQPITATLVVTGPDMAAVGAQPALAGGMDLPVIPGASLTITNPGSDPVTVTLTQLSPEGEEVNRMDAVAFPGSRILALTAGSGSYRLTPGGPGLRAAVVIQQLGEAAGLAVAPLGVGGAVGLSVAIDYDPSFG
ncbi:MAG: DUF5719 family protein, partial [Propionibacteriaceae bacterium]|nr:DUF5719 family protein [Propionibacteriaceae bacterium]